MTFEQFKSRYLLKLREHGLASNDIEVKKLFIAATVLSEHQAKQLKRESRR